MILYAQHESDTGVCGNTSIVTMKEGDFVAEEVARLKDSIINSDHAATKYIEN